MKRSEHKTYWDRSRGFLKENNFEPLFIHKDTKEVVALIFVDERASPSVQNIFIHKEGRKPKTKSFQTSFNHSTQWPLPMQEVANLPRGCKR